MMKDHVCKCSIKDNGNGGRVWFYSKTTLLEKLAYLVGYYKDGDIGRLTETDRPLAGRAEAIKAAWEK